jgi:ubiquinone/menaquinone biosynthesis C-methylase UbiE
MWEDRQMVALFRRRPRVSLRQIRREQEYIFGQGHLEANRLDLQHFMFRWEFADDYSAPLRSPLTVLDVACGTGRWAREMAVRFPHAAVFGFDINQDQINMATLEATRRGEQLPENCTFLTGNALHPFDFADNSFQLVMARANSAFVPVERWPALLAEMRRVTAPNGWIEVRDFGVLRSESLALTAMTGIFVNLAAGLGIHPGVGPHIAKYFAVLPLRDQRIRTLTVRASPHRPTRGGRLLLADYLALMERVTPLVVRNGLATEAQWKQLWQQARLETNRCTTEVELTAAIGRC